MFFLISALLGVGWGSHEVLESYRVTRHVVSDPAFIYVWGEKSLPFKQIDPVEPVVAPALADLEI